MRTVALAALLSTLSACQRQGSGPPGDCAAVAETLASIELGNYADPAVRAPVVAKKRELCTSAHVTGDEAACLAKATNKFAAATCVPRMFPDVKVSGSADCAEVTAHMREMLVQQMGQAGSQALGMVDKMMPALQQSCVEDQWPTEVKRCFINGQDPTSMQACSDQMPKDLQKKAADRMAAAAR
jgi:hypothetical protein